MDQPKKQEMGRALSLGVWGLALAATLGMSAMTPFSAGAEILNGVIASVDGEALTLGDLREYERTRSPFLPADMRGNFEASLEALIETRLLEIEFIQNDIRAGDRDVEMYIQGILQENGQTTDTVLTALAEAGLEWNDYFERMRQEVQRLALINAVIRSRVSVSPEDVERAWKTDPRFIEPVKVQIAHIYLPFSLGTSEGLRQLVLDKATEIRESVSSARSFAAAAKEHSQGPTAADGGSLGAFRRGSMAPHFERAVEGLRDGGISAPIETADGVHIVRLERTLPEQRRPLEEVREELHSELYDLRLNERFERWASQDLRTKHFIEDKLEELALLAAL